MKKDRYSAFNTIIARMEKFGRLDIFRKLPFNKKKIKSKNLRGVTFHKISQIYLKSKFYLDAGRFYIEQVDGRKLRLTFKKILNDVDCISERGSVVSIYYDLKTKKILKCDSHISTKKANLNQMPLEEVKDLGDLLGKIMNKTNDFGVRKAINVWKSELKNQNYTHIDHFVLLNDLETPQKAMSMDTMTESLFQSEQIY